MPRLILLLVACFLPACTPPGSSQSAKRTQPARQAPSDDTASNASGSKTTRAAGAVVAPTTNTRRQGAEESNRVVEARSDPHAVVVELFTSEGCSSCPPADGLLEALQRGSSAQAPVVALSLHVDYWDYLGWRDPFSNALYSKRQRWYAGLDAERRVYTPQMVVDGTRRFVGSNRALATRAIAAARQREKPVEISLRTTAGDNWRVDYEVRGASGEAYLHLALLQPHAVSEVERGENTGEELRHVGVVRDLATTRFERATRGAWTPSVPSELKSTARVVAFVQNPQVGSIDGVAAWPPSAFVQSAAVSDGPSEP